MRQTITVRPAQYLALLERSANEWGQAPARYYVEHSPYPRNPWVIRDTVERRAVPTSNGRGFLHYATAEQAGAMAQRLNAKEGRG